MNKLSSKLIEVKSYWKNPPKGRFMPFREIAAYAGGGIGAYFIIQLGSTLIVSTTNIIVSNAIGVGPAHTYIIYLLATLLNIPLTGIRANMIDNSRGKGGKYRPYLLSMGIPTALIAIVYVWFPYQQMYALFPGKLFGFEKGYLIKLAVVFICNLALHFFFNFFRDAYENLIHVLSPNTQERTDVLAIKAVIYSLAPSIMNIVNPVVAQFFADNDQTNILVYKITYPIYAILGIGLTVIVWGNTKEKIVQAKTHTIQIRFIDALKEVAKNKYFWIISLAGWLGFLEQAYGNILLYSQSYGHSVDGSLYAVASTVLGNASLWGMLFAPFFVRRFGKKKVLVTVNLMNVACILLMLVNVKSFWWLVVCVWINYLFGSVEQITSPAIQADIRDYQQYRSGERIDGMFAAVGTIGNIVTLATSAVLPAVQQKYGIFEGNGFEKPFDILDIEKGQPDLLYRFLPVLIIVAAFGALMNVLPYFFYDFNEVKQKSVIRVLKVRSLFEDYGNNALNDEQIVEVIDLVRDARTLAEKEMSSPEKGLSRKEKKALRERNEEIEISKFVCDELDKFEKPIYIHRVQVAKAVFDAGLGHISGLNKAQAKSELKAARSMPKGSDEEKELRKFRIETAKGNISAKRAYDRYFRDGKFTEPDMADLTELFDREDMIDEKLRELAELETKAKKEKNKGQAVDLRSKIRAVEAEKKAVQKQQKELMDDFAKFNRAAKPYIDAKKLLTQEKNYRHFDDISGLYTDAKNRVAESKTAEQEQDA